jgi:hypothetical protein
MIVLYIFQSGIKLMTNGWKGIKIKKKEKRKRKEKSVGYDERLRAELMAARRHPPVAYAQLGDHS